MGRGAFEQGLIKPSDAVAGVQVQPAVLGCPYAVQAQSIVYIQ